MSETKKRSRGRPAIGSPTTLRLSADMLSEIDAALGPGERRADLIRAAIERELERRQRNRDYDGTIARNAR